MLDIPAHRKLCEAATKGPWEWTVNRFHRQVYLVGVTNGREYVIDFARWGMSGATPRFRNIAIKYEPMEPAEKFAAPVEGREHHADWFQTINHPDAAFICAARTALPAALDEIESLRAELAAARAAKPVAWAIFNDRMSGPVVGCDEAEIRGNATMTGDRVVPLIIPPWAGG